MRFERLLVFLLVVMCAPIGLAQKNPFVGKWNITGRPPHDSYVYWLEVKEESGKLSAMFLNRGGSPVPVEGIKLTGEELTFNLPGRSGRPLPEVQLKAAGEKITGSLKSGDQTIILAGSRPPKWRDYNANARHTFGKPVDLFDGKSLDAWTVQNREKPMDWRIEDGVMTNATHGNNLVSKEKFQDFKIQAEYKLEKGSNSGIYIRGRYELQVLDDYGKEPESHGHMAIYARKAPDLNASKPAGEWQSMEATVVGNRVTVLLNGKKVHDNAVIQGITGGALDVNETEPGPVMIQGDHERVWFRKVTVTPIVNSRRSS